MLKTHCGHSVRYEHIEYTFSVFYFCMTRDWHTLHSTTTMPRMTMRWVSVRTTGSSTVKWLMMAGSPEPWKEAENGGWSRLTMWNKHSSSASGAVKVRFAFAIMPSRLVSSAGMAAHFFQMKTYLLRNQVPFLSVLMGNTHIWSSFH